MASTTTTPINIHNMTTSVEDMIAAKLDVQAPPSSPLPLCAPYQSPRSLSPTGTTNAELLHAPSSPSINKSSTSPTPTKRPAKDVLSAQILIGMKNLIPTASTTGSPNSPLSAPASPLPIQAPPSPSVASDTEKPSSPRDHQLPTSTNAASNNNINNSSNSPVQSNCTFKECLLCKRGTPFVNNQSPTWACIMRIVFYCLQNEITSKPFLNLKTDVYGFMTAHWHLLCLDKKRSDNWHKQIQDMLSHSKNLFESGMDTYKQNGYWRMKQITDPWDEIKSKKVVSKRKRSYSEADKDHSSKNASATASTVSNTPTSTNNNNNNNSDNSNVAIPVVTVSSVASSMSPVPSSSSLTPSSIDKKIHENFCQLSSQLNKNKESSKTPATTPPINLSLTSPVASATPISASKSVSTPRLKKKQKINHLIPATTLNTSKNNTSGFAIGSNHQAPIPTLPIISMLDEGSLKIDESDVEVNIEDVEEIKPSSYDDESPMGLLLSSVAAAESKIQLLPMLREQQQTSADQSTSASSSVAGETSTLSFVANNVGGNPTSAPTSPPTTATSPSSLLLMREEEISLLKQQLQLICSNLTLINQTDDHSIVQSMIEKEIQRISTICTSSNNNSPSISLTSSTNNTRIADRSESPSSTSQVLSSLPFSIDKQPTTSSSSSFIPNSPIRLNSSAEQISEESDCVPNLNGLNALMTVTTNNI